MINTITNTNHTSDSILNDALIDMKFITQYTGLTDKWFYKLIQEGKFPKPIKLGRSSRWFKSEVEQWLELQISASRGVNVMSHIVELTAE